MSLLALDTFERHRATHTPNGWSQEGERRQTVLPRAWRIGTSAWRVASGSRWTSEDKHKQAYVRPLLEPESTLGLSLSSQDGVPVWIWLDANGAVWAEKGGDEISCMGKIAKSPEVQAIELKVDPDGLMVTRGDHKMICARDNEDDQTVKLRVEKGPIEIRSIGRDRLSDGVPLSPLWWMSGLMALGFIWMLFLDLMTSLIRRLGALFSTSKEPIGSPREE